MPHVAMQRASATFFLLERDNTAPNCRALRRHARGSNRAFNKKPRGPGVREPRGFLVWRLALRARDQNPSRSQMAFVADAALSV